jgi:hypothetical protein
MQAVDTASWGRDTRGTLSPHTMAGPFSPIASSWSCQEAKQRRHDSARTAKKPTSKLCRWCAAKGKKSSISKAKLRGHGSGGGRDVVHEMKAVPLENCGW